MEKGVKMYQVDAFADRPFAGNPAAVCLLDGEREKDWLQQVAAEMNLSETAFLVQQAAHEWQLRWFTPRVEVDLCGHATLAAAHVLWNHLGRADETLRFQTRSGLLTASRSGGKISLDFPADPPVACAPTGTLVAGLGLEPKYAANGRDDLLVVLEDPALVRRLQPDLAQLAALPVRGVIVTAPSDSPDWDFLSRFFAPGAGIPEDPVTGSAHCILGPYWGARLGKSELNGFQASARGGTVGVQLAGNRVRLLGSAVTVVEGRLCA